MSSEFGCGGVWTEGNLSIVGREVDVGTGVEEVRDVAVGCEEDGHLTEALRSGVVRNSIVSSDDVQV